MNQLNEKDIGNIHKKMLEMMVFIKFFCEKNNIRYSLHAGTLLGAIRHQAFIPWDDDADFVLEREEFEKLKNKIENTEDFPYDFGLDGLWVHRLSESVKLSYDTAPINRVAIDFFVLDEVPNSNIRFKVQILQLKTLQGMIKPIVQRKGNLAIDFIQFSLKSFGRLFSYERKIKWYEKISKKGKGSKSGYYFISNDQYKYISNKYSQNIFEKEIPSVFENETFNISSGWREILETLYGSNYMELPPVEMRKPNHLLQI